MGNDFVNRFKNADAEERKILLKDISTGNAEALYAAGYTLDISDGCVTGASLRTDKQYLKHSPKFSTLDRAN